MVFVSLGGPAITVRSDEGVEWRFEDHPWCGPLFVNKYSQGINDMPPDDVYHRISKWYQEGKPIYKVKGVLIVSDKREVGFIVGGAHACLKYANDLNGHVYWAFKLLYEHQTTLNKLIDRIEAHDCNTPICSALYVSGFASFNLQPDVLRKAIGAKSRSTGFYGVQSYTFELVNERKIRRDNLVECLKMLVRFEDEVNGEL